MKLQIRMNPKVWPNTPRLRASSLASQRFINLTALAARHRPLFEAALAYASTDQTPEFLLGPSIP